MVPLTESSQFHLVRSQGPVSSFWTVELIIESVFFSFLFGRVTGPLDQEVLGLNYRPLTSKGESPEKRFV